MDFTKRGNLIIESRNRSFGPSGVNCRHQNVFHLIHETRKGETTHVA